MGFIFSECFNSFLICQFSTFSFWFFPIFLMSIAYCSLPHPDCIFLPFVLESPILFSYFTYSAVCNIMAEAFRFMPLGLIRLRTFWLSTWGSQVQTWAQVFMRVRDGADVTLRDVTIAQMGNWDRECEWRHAPEARGAFCEFWRMLLELRPASGGDGWLSLARGGLGQASNERGGLMKKPE